MCICMYTHIPPQRYVNFFLFLGQFNNSFTIYFFAVLLLLSCHNEKWTVWKFYFCTFEANCHRNMATFIREQRDNYGPQKISDFRLSFWYSIWGHLIISGSLIFMTFNIVQLKLMTVKSKGAQTPDFQSARPSPQLHIPTLEHLNKDIVALEHAHRWKAKPLKPATTPQVCL